MDAAASMEAFAVEESASVPVHGEARPVPVERRRLPLANILGFVVGLIGIAAIGASAFVYSQTQREIVRLSTDIAQLRLSMELFARQQGVPSDTDKASLADLANRLAILEDDWRNTPAPTAGPPAISDAAPADTAAGDCLPTGTRFMVATGDRYPVCGSDAVFAAVATAAWARTGFARRCRRAGGRSCFPGASTASTARRIFCA